MARTLNISQASDKKELATVLQKAAQSANLNFLIGAGCSSPAIEMLGNIEKHVQNKIDAGEHDEAHRILFDYLRPFIRSVEYLKGTPNEDHATVLDNYGCFLAVISEILFERKSSIIPKQANIFSTNYDLFIEKASESFLGSLNLNDGFSRRPSLDSTFQFSTDEFFNSIYNNGNLYGYEVQIPSINLLKLHGSLSWINDADRILFSVVHLAPLKDEMDKIGRDGDIPKIREINGKFSVILPNREKFQNTLLSQFHYDLLRIYANELDKENTLLVAEGFSFDDEHILNITRRALRNPTLRLVIFSFEEDEVAKYKTKFGKHGNVDIVYSETEKIGFADFNTLLNDVLPKNTVKTPTNPEGDTND
jgi:hypothetical protein